jgi:CDGSH-type Zn-finger protein
VERGKEIEHFLFYILLTIGVLKFMLMDKKTKVTIAGLRSIKLDTEPGIYFWCACGKSANQPFCDGSHQGTGIEPMQVNIEEKKLIKWCSCKHTKTPPYCDHSHRELPGYKPKEQD